MPKVDTNKLREFLRDAPGAGLLDSDSFAVLEEIDRLTEAANNAREALKGIMDHYGTNLSVYNYHLNGEGEAFDNFIDENGLWDAMDKLNEVLGDEKPILGWDGTEIGCHFCGAPDDFCAVEHRGNDRVSVCGTCFDKEDGPDGDAHEHEC